MSVSASIGAIRAWSSQETAATGESRAVVELLVAVADELDPPRSLSPTSARTWQQCELRYALSYLYGWQEGATLPQVVGNTVHRAVELLYGLDPSQRRRDVASQLLRGALADETGRDEVAALVERHADLAGQVTSAGEDALDGLFVLEDPARITVDPEGLEVRVVAELYGVPVRGRIDRLYDASGAYVVADYKSGRVPRPAYTATAFFGLWTYAAALAASDPDRVLPDRVELLYLVGRERLARPVVRGRSPSCPRPGEDLASDPERGPARRGHGPHEPALRLVCLQQRLPRPDKGVTASSRQRRARRPRRCARAPPPRPLQRGQDAGAGGVTRRA